MTILFLDFDGVLHPHEVYRYKKRGIVLKAGPEHSLFEHGERLATLLAPFPEVRIVLSTSWCRMLKSYDRAKERLPESLQSRVVGATWHSAKDPWRWGNMTRFEQIYQYVIRHQIANWLAIDDDDELWPDHCRKMLVYTDEWYGLGKEETQRELQEKLMQLRNSGGDKETRPVHMPPGSCWLE